jgi:uncharacterized protein YbaA (DUF1428 family)
MNYIDGFVCAVPNANKQAYIEHAKKTGAIFKDYGALRVVDTWADDVPEGKLTSFSFAVKREETESVVFSWVEWASREARDAGWENIMKDPRMAQNANPMPFDGKRMIYGGFSAIAQQ